MTHVKCIAEGFSSVQCLSNAADGVRLAARIVDTPCNEMNTDHFLDVSENITTGTFPTKYSYFDAAPLTDIHLCFRKSGLWELNLELLQ